MNSRIGIFDSGVGGITVLQALRQRFPAHETIYLGDTAHVPYGSRSAAQVGKFSVDCIETLVARAPIAALVVACNTASALALDKISAAAGAIPVIGVVEPGVRAACDAVAGNRSEAPLLVLGTQGTIRSGIYGRLIQAALPGRKLRIIEQACPMLAPMIEEGWLTHPILRRTIEEYVGSHRDAAKTPGTALLACTHYPWIREAFEAALPGWTVVDSADAVAQSLSRILPAPSSESAGRLDPRKTEWIFTDPDALPEFARRWIAS